MGYRLSLSNGMKWWLTGSPDIFPWLSRLASIMRLAESGFDGCSRLLFSRMGKQPVSRTPAERLPSAAGSDRTVWDHGNLSVCFHDDTTDALCEVDNSKGHDAEILNMWNALHPVYRDSVRRGGLPFHAALMERDGAGILLAAPGGTGKSTCCRRIPMPWRPLCDDEALVVRDEKGDYRAHPFPTWSDYLWRRAEKSWDVQYSVPVRAVFFLAHAEAEMCESLGQAAAAARMSESSRQVCEKYWLRKQGEPRRAFTSGIFLNACEMARRVPAFTLGISLNGRFWEELDRVLSIIDR